MNSNSVHFKAFLRNDNNCEARRFVIEDPSVVTNYEYMKEKLRMVYPVIRETIFRITWKDEDGDEITITCDEDLLTAITEMTNRVKILYITILEKAKPGDIEIEAEIRLPCGNIYCDGCDTQIKGYRYKCITCPDFDLCAKCEQCGIHSEHIMIRIANTEMYLPRCAKKLANHFARSMKKAHHFASKEAHRAAKFAANKAHERYTQKTNEFKPSTSQTEDNTNTKTKCPMEEQIPLANLTEMAMPFLDMFAQNTTGGRGEQFVESIRRALNNFMDSENFGENQNNNEQTPQNVSGNKSDTSNQTEMDVEAEPTPNNTNKENGKGENDWTFVSKNLEELAKREDTKTMEGLQKLLDMGFANEEYLIVLLKRFGGNIEAVIKYLLETEDHKRYDLNMFK